MSLDERVERLPGVLAYRRWKYRRRFARERNANLFWGVFGTFEEALRATPREAAVGYDHAETARLYAEHLDVIRFQHYPVLFWLARRWTDLGTVLDFGGHRGSLYYAARRALGPALGPSAGPGPEWIVHDVPAVAEEGRREAERRGETRLRFVSDLSGVGGIDAVVAAGSLQYVEDPASTWLDRAGAPRHVLLNATPFHPTRAFVTLNNIGPAYCPYRIRKVGEFETELERRGYRTVATWAHEGKSCAVPFEIPEGEVVYRGGYFTRD